MSPALQPRCEVELQLKASATFSPLSSTGFPPTHNKEATHSSALTAYKKYSAAESLRRWVNPDNGSIEPPTQHGTQPAHVWHVFTSKGVEMWKTAKRLHESSDIWLICSYFFLHRNDRNGSYRSSEPRVLFDPRTTREDLKCTTLQKITASCSRGR